MAMCSLLVLDLGSEQCQRSSIIGKRKCTIPNPQASLDANYSDSDIHTEEDNHWSHGRQDIIPTQHSHKYPDYFNALNIFSQTNQNGNFPFSKSLPEVSRNSKDKMFISDNKFLAVKDDLLVNEAICEEICRDGADDNSFSSQWGNDSFEDNFDESADEFDPVEQ